MFRKKYYLSYQRCVCERWPDVSVLVQLVFILWNEAGAVRVWYFGRGQLVFLPEDSE